MNIRFASVERGIGLHGKCSHWQMIGLTIQLPRRLGQPIWEGLGKVQAGNSFNGARGRAISLKKTYLLKQECKLVGSRLGWLCVNGFRE